MKKWGITIAKSIITIGLVAVAVLGWWYAWWWLPKLLEFAFEKSATIEGLAGILEIVGRAFSIIAFICGLWFTWKKEVQQRVVNINANEVIMGDVTYTRSQLEELNDYLNRAVSEFEARMYQITSRTVAPPNHPYKFLYSFDIEDADIFFGRNAAAEALHARMLNARLTVLHARSGAGKTSLLNAGLSPRLIREGRLPVYARAYDNPVIAIKKAIAPPSSGKWPELLPKLTLHEFLGMACKHLGRKTDELVIILDQFEEFFVFRPGPDHRRPFIDALGDCQDDPSLPVRFLISLCKDYYSDLTEFEWRIPTIIHNHYRLGDMSRNEACEAITGPVAKLGRPVVYEQALIDALLEDLAHGGMELPHLQIICTKLYDTLPEGEAGVTLTSYEKMGGAEGVLGCYLNEKLKELKELAGIAKEVLKELVSSKATKRVLSYKELARRLGTEQDELNEVLKKLVNKRLLRRDDVLGEVTYEMAHEYLIGEISTWIDESELEFKQAQELLAREVENWRVYGVLIPSERLKLIYPRKKLTSLDEDAKECLLISALQFDFEVLVWASLIGEDASDLLIAALQDENSIARQAAARALGKLRESGAVESLIAALQDGDKETCSVVAWALGEIGDLRAVKPLCAIIQKASEEEYTISNEYVLRVVVEALGKIRDPYAVDYLGIALKDVTYVSYNAATALGEIGNAKAIEYLCDFLKWGSGYPLGAAVDALAKIGKPAIEQLVLLLNDKDSNVRRRAIEVLKKMNAPEAIAVVEKYQED